MSNRKAYVAYCSNNSGGSWWLDDAAWLALEKAGWKVAWYSAGNFVYENGDHVLGDDGLPRLDGGRNKWADANGRFLGARAKLAFRAGLSLRAAVEEWERVTGKSSTDAGCPCCGPPHQFYEYGADGKVVASGPEITYSALWESNDE